MWPTIQNTISTKHIRRNTCSILFVQTFTYIFLNHKSSPVPSSPHTLSLSLSPLHLFLFRLLCFYPVFAIEKWLCNCIYVCVCNVYLQLLRLHDVDLHAHLRRKFQNLKAKKKKKMLNVVALLGCSNSDRNDFNDF